MPSENFPPPPARITEQRSVVMSGTDMEFHGYSVAEVKELLMFMRELSGSPDAARWTPGSAP